MKSSLKKIFLAFSVIYFCMTANAQIIYTDINPDTTISAGHSYNLDLNNDGITDFIISDSSWNVTFSSMCIGSKANANFTVTPLHQNAVLSDTNHRPYAFAANDIIEATSSLWSNTADQSLEEMQYQCRSSRGSCGTPNGYCLFANPSGHWNLSSDYLALKLVSGGNTYYGWVRLAIQFGNTPTITAQEYAFNNTPDAPILAGQKNIFTWVAIDSISPLKKIFCAGDSLKIKYTVFGTFNASNVFTAQLSDSNGSFIHAITIGSVTSTTSGIINSKMPQNISSGAQFSLRVISSNPYTDSIYGVQTGITIGGGITAGYYPTTFCAGNVAELTAPPGYAYQWLDNGKIISGETGYVFDAVASGNYTCIISGLCGTDTSNTIPITVYPLPLAPIVTSGVTTFCKGGKVTLSDTVDKECTYQWGWSYNGGVPALIPGATQSSYTADSTGAYTVAVTSKNGCTTQADYISVDAIPPPLSANIETDSVGKTNFCAGDSLLLGITFDYFDPGPIYFQWKKDGTTITGATLEVYYARTAGTYTCEITNMCNSTTSNGITLTTNQCPKANSLPVVIVGPNPFPNATNISITLPQQQKTMINIYDMRGKIVTTLVDAELNAGVHTLTWNATDNSGSAVLRGMYFIKIQTEQDVQTKKIIVLR